MQALTKKTFLIPMYILSLCFNSAVVAGAAFPGFPSDDVNVSDGFPALPGDQPNVPVPSPVGASSTPSGSPSALPSSSSSAPVKVCGPTYITLQINRNPSAFRTIWQSFIMSSVNDSAKFSRPNEILCACSHVDHVISVYKTMCDMNCDVGTLDLIDTIMNEVQRYFVDGTNHFAQYQGVIQTKMQWFMNQYKGLCMSCHAFKKGCLGK